MDLLVLDEITLPSDHRRGVADPSSWVSAPPVRPSSPESVDAATSRGSQPTSSGPPSIPRRVSAIRDPPVVEVQTPFEADRDGPARAALRPTLTARAHEVVPVNTGHIGAEPRHKP